jgi:hypothetical protein
MTEYPTTRLSVCSEFLATSSNPKLCHLCLHQKGEHPADNDSEYWFQWFVSHTILELTFPIEEPANVAA